jgi:hypothetical protein
LILRSERIWVFMVILQTKRVVGVFVRFRAPFTQHKDSNLNKSSDALIK